MNYYNGENIWNAATRAKWSVKVNSFDISAVYNRLNAMQWLRHLETYKKKKAMWILLGADIQTEEIILLLDMHTVRTLQNVNCKYLDSQSLNNRPRANKSSNQRIKTIQDLYVMIRITCQDFLPANWGGGREGRLKFLYLQYKESPFTPHWFRNLAVQITEVFFTQSYIL